MSIPKGTFEFNDLTALFKIKYEKLSENVYNSANVLLGRVKKSYNFTGKRLSIAIPQSFAGGVGSGSLPTANRAIYSDAQITSKKMYAVVEVDRETIKASLSDEGAFVRATKEVVQKGVESFMRNLSRALFADGSGMIAEGDGTTNVTGDGSDLTPYVVALAESSFKEANIEERDLVQMGSETTDPLEIVKVNLESSPKTIELVGTSAILSAAADVGSNPQVPSPTSAKIYMQGSKDKDPEGLRLLDKVASGSNDFLGNSIAHLANQNSNYGIDVGRRWKAVQKDAGQAAVSTDMLNEVMLKIKKQCGKTPNLIVCSFKQYEKILNLLEDQKRYTINTRAGLKSKSGADISFSGVEFMSVDGPVGIFPERFVEDDRIYLLNDSHIHIHHRPDFGWFDDDGTVFLRKHDSDAYEARYGGYLQVYINPCFHGVIADLSV